MIRANIGNDKKPMKISDTLRNTNIIFALVFFFKEYIFQITRLFVLRFAIVPNTISVFNKIYSAVLSFSPFPQKYVSLLLISVISTMQFRSPVFEIFSKLR